MLRLVASLIEWGVKRWHYKSRFEGKLDAMLSNQIEHSKRLLRLEISEAIRRDDRAVVHQLYDEYKAMGGNSYMNELYRDYCKKPTKRSKK